ncbi:MAG: hypothetical protein ACKN89_06410 [Cyanobium sp.]
MLITIFSSYSDASFPFAGMIALDQQTGVLFLFSPGCAAAWRC